MGSLFLHKYKFWIHKLRLKSDVSNLLSLLSWLRHWDRCRVIDVHCVIELTYLCIKSSSSRTFDSSRMANWVEFTGKWNHVTHNHHNEGFKQTIYGLHLVYVFWHLLSTWMLAIQCVIKTDTKYHHLTRIWRASHLYLHQWSTVITWLLLGVLADKSVQKSYLCEILQRITVILNVLTLQMETINLDYIQSPTHCQQLWSRP